MKGDKMDRKAAIQIAIDAMSLLDPSTVELCASAEEFQEAFQILEAEII